MTELEQQLYEALKRFTEWRTEVHGNMLDDDALWLQAEAAVVAAEEKLGELR